MEGDHLGQCGLRRVAVASAIGSITAICSAGAGVFDWSDPGGGSFQDRSNWSPAGGPPGAADTARFLIDSPVPASVSFVESVTNQFVVVDAATWTFDLGGGTWSVTGDYPGATFDGNVTVVGGTLQSEWAIVLGQFLLDATATWQNANSIYLPGLAELIVPSGAALHSGWIDVAGGSTGEAMLAVEGPGALVSCPTSVLAVGSGGSGSLLAGSGALIESLWGELGSMVDASGVAIVTGGSEWHMDGSVTLIGIAGDGQLSVSDGGRVTTGFLANIADLAGSTGHVMLEGDAQWMIAGDLGVGDAGDGWLALATSPGLGDPVASVGGAMRVGGEASGSGHVDLYGTGARLDIAGFGVVGREGAGNLTIGLGSEATVAGPLALGELANGAGVVTLDGAFAIPAPPVLEVGGYLAVGAGGQGSLSALTQGHITAGSAIIAIEPGSVGEVSLLFGPDLTTEGFIEVGRGGHGSLTIDVFSAVECEALSAGIESGATGEVTISFASLTALDGALSLGLDGTGSLHADDGAQIDVLGGADGAGGLVLLGLNPGSSGDLSLSGDDTLLDASAQLACGSFGQGVLHIADGAELRALKSTSPSGSAGILGLNDGGSGSAVIESGGHLNCVDGFLVVGFRDGATGSLRLESGGLATSMGGFVGREAGSTGEVVVTGAGSLWSSGADVSVGDLGEGMLEAASGGRVQAPQVFVGGNGTLAGDGTIEGELVNAGVVAPGAPSADSTASSSIGSLHVYGEYTQSSTGRLVLEIGGTSPGQWDMLVGNFSGFFDLGGTLEIVLVDGFVPVGGETLIVMAGGFMTDTFDQLVGPVPYTFARGETVGLLTFCEPADLNCDGVVNGGDLGLQLAQWGGPGTGDLNHDGVVDGADVGLLLAAWSG